MSQKTRTRMLTMMLSVTMKPEDERTQCPQIGKWINAILISALYGQSFFHFSQQKLVSMFPFLPSNTGFVLANWDRSETVLLLAQSLKCPQHPVHSLGALSHHVRKPDCQAGWRSDMERGPGRYEIKMRKFQPVDQSATPCRWQTCAWQRDYSALGFPTRSTQYRPDRHTSSQWRAF